MTKHSVHRRPSLTQRLRGASGEVLKFAVVGVIGIVVNFGVSNAMIHATHWAPVRCSVIGTAVAILVNYVGYRYWVYGESDAASRRREITLFLVFSGIGLLIENGTVWFTTYSLGMTGTLALNASKMAGTGVATLFRFFSYRTWVFKAMPELAEHEQQPGQPVVVAQAERILAAEESNQYAK
ncbi:GtrA family protein [Kitasatospora sp. NBC_01266]|uniref:GtrA family protein n=1 Tax=Kitasatospora sp. NBC_01266 TaxID=2903572 RepID=UPI002E2F3E52|nr:GtrA family protein [Kitasatospora sp. NBC_01266]